jgi:hypothetical protein
LSIVKFTTPYFRGEGRGEKRIPNHGIRLHSKIDNTKCISHTSVTLFQKIYRWSTEKNCACYRIFAPFDLELIQKIENAESTLKEHLLEYIWRCHIRLLQLPLHILTTKEVH